MKLITALVLLSAVGLGTYGYYRSTPDAVAPGAVQPAPTSVEQPNPAPEISVPVMTREQAIAKPFPRRAGGPPITIGPFTVPDTLYITIVATNNGTANQLVGVTGTLISNFPGSWVGTVQIPNGGISFIAQFDARDPGPLPSWDVIAVNGSRESGPPGWTPAIDPFRWPLEARTFVKATSMAPVAVNGTWRGFRSKQSVDPNGLVPGTIDFVIRP